MDHPGSLDVVKDHAIARHLAPDEAAKTKPFRIKAARDATRTADAAVEQARVDAAASIARAEVNAAKAHEYLASLLT